MKETTGYIKTWNAATGQGVIQGYDGNFYPFAKKEWAEEDEPSVDGGVRVICQNGRDASKIEHLPIEHMPRMKVTTHTTEGEAITTQTRFIGGPWRMRSDALAWMMTAKELHSKISHHPIEDISGLLLGEHYLISIRGSVIKYCYGFAIELYLKWILTEANIEFNNSRNHRMKDLLNKLPQNVIDSLRDIYTSFCEVDNRCFRMMQADKSNVVELNLDWSTFDKLIDNIDNQKFIIGRYATPNDYSIIPSSSNRLSKEMNSYMDSNDFFNLADTILSYKPSLNDYD